MPGLRHPGPRLHPSQNGCPCPEDGIEGAWRSGRRLTVDRVGPLFKGFREHAERTVEHRAHYRGKYATFEFVVDEETHETAVASGLEAPDIAQIFERPVDIFHVDGQFLGLEQHLGGKGFTDRLVADTHVSHEYRLAVALPA